MCAELVEAGGEYEFQFNHDQRESDTTGAAGQRISGSCQQDIRQVKFLFMVYRYCFLYLYLYSSFCYKTSVLYTCRFNKTDNASSKFNLFQIFKLLIVNVYNFL